MKTTETFLVVFLGVLFGELFVANLFGRQVVYCEGIIPYLFLQNASRVVFHLECNWMNFTFKYIPQKFHDMLTILSLQSQI
jgi:hypothetical protein